MNSTVVIIDYMPGYQSSIRKILTKIGWAEQYVASAEQNMQNLSADKENYGVYLAIANESAVGFLYVQDYAWNQLCQIHGLAVDVDFHRQGIASALVARAEEFARLKKARGIYVDTPTNNTRGRRISTLPRRPPAGGEMLRSAQHDIKTPCFRVSVVSA